VVAVPNFRIETTNSRFRETGSRTTIKLTGELDSGTCGQLVSSVERVLEARKAREIVLDLAEVSFIDSSGMRAIVIIERAAAERGIELTIVSPAEPVTDLLRIVGIAERLPLVSRAGDRAPGGPLLERIEVALASERTAPARARAELREALGGRLTEADKATVTLLASELVTNAVIHPGPGAGGPIRLRIAAYSTRVRVEVTDAGAGFDPGTLPAGPRETGGHGLIVVDGLASRWGVTRGAPDAAGFCVWFELDVDYDLSSAPRAPEPEPDEPSVAAAES
jgi:anti-anti-sigma factor